MDQNRSRWPARTGLGTAAQSGVSTPGAGLTSPIASFVDLVRHLILPTITLALVDIGQFVLITRSSLVDVLTEDR